MPPLCIYHYILIDVKWSPSILSKHVTRSWTWTPQATVKTKTRQVRKLAREITDNSLDTHACARTHLGTRSMPVGKAFDGRGSVGSALLCILRPIAG